MEEGREYAWTGMEEFIMKEYAMEKIGLTL